MMNKGIYGQCKGIGCSKGNTGQCLVDGFIGENVAENVKKWIKFGSKE
jgi:hypothetical protein